MVCGEPAPQRRLNAVARQQQRPPVGINVAIPEWRGTFGHVYRALCAVAERLALPAKMSMVRPENGISLETPRISLVKVIASSVRKGNIIDLDGKLYVVLTAENFHPGKGTPTTQIDMRRISDGVKTSVRYKTTDQLERAHVE